ncbi:hypothetical protein AXH25_04415 (plasmid) [Borrelia miyamotoi]|nr:hypothetical protein AXH25_04415 [Borrelia miyamotoi]
MELKMDNDFKDLRKIYARVLDLLLIKSEELSFEDFNVYLELLEDILVSKGFGLQDLNVSKAFLLIYYFFGCELKKRGKLLHFDFNKVKSERFNEISIEYSDCMLRDEALSRDFCVDFNNLIEDVIGYKRLVIGSV